MDNNGTFPCKRVYTYAAHFCFVNILVSSFWMMHALIDDVAYLKHTTSANS